MGPGDEAPDAHPLAKTVSYLYLRSDMPGAMRTIMYWLAAVKHVLTQATRVTCAAFFLPVSPSMCSIPTPNKSPLYHPTEYIVPVTVHRLEVDSITSTNLCMVEVASSPCCTSITGKIIPAGRGSGEDVIKPSPSLLGARTRPTPTNQLLIPACSLSNVISPQPTENVPLPPATNV